MSKPSIHERMVAHMERLLVTQGYSPQTRDTYIRWTQRFTKFLGYPHPRQIGTKEIAAFLDHLAKWACRCDKTAKEERDEFSCFPMRSDPTFETSSTS